jgi:hypothetical protein
MEICRSIVEVEEFEIKQRAEWKEGRVSFKKFKQSTQL